MSDGRDGAGDAPGRIAVTGATGLVGGALCARLAGRDVTVRAIARSASARILPGPRLEPVDRDLHDAPAVGEALAGCDALFLLTPLEEAMPEIGARLVEAALAAGVRRIVRLSAFGAGDAAPNTLGRVHRAVEEAVEEACRASEVEWTVLRPNSFMQNYATYCGHEIRADGVFHMPQGEGAVSVVDARDVAAVAERALLAPGHAGRIYELTGPEGLANAGVAEALGAATGRPVRYVDVPEADARRAMLGAGLPPWLTEVIMELYAMSKAGGASRLSPDVERVLGRPPTSFADYARERRADFL